MEINLEMDALERVVLETNNSDDPMAKEIGKFIQEQFAEDLVLKNAYFERKITLDDVCEYVKKLAKEYLNGKNGAISDKIVFGWVLHFIQDEKVVIKTESTYTLSETDKEKAKERALKQFQEQELKKLQKELEKAENKTKKAIEKEQKRNEEIGQMSLFDL